MEHIKTPVQIDLDGVGTFCDVGSGNIKFEAVIIVDQDEQICLVPTDLKSGPEKIAAEIVQACNCFDDLLAACERAKQTISNLAMSGALEGDSRIIALNEAENLRGDIAKAKGDQCSA